VDTTADKATVSGGSAANIKQPADVSSRKVVLLHG
jgi:hypothetical protein